MGELPEIMESRFNQHKFPATLTYTLLGTLFGALFPVAAQLWIYAEEFGGVSGIRAFLIEAHNRHPLLYMIDMAPIFLGGVAWVAGHREERLRYLNKHLEKKVEERTKELNLLAIAFDTGLATMITDADGQILRVNQAFTYVTGYSPKEVLGGNPRIFQSGLQDDDFYYELWREIHRFGYWKGELWNKRRGGEAYPLWESITAVRGEEGQVEYYVAVFDDISERKQLEDSRNRLLEILEATPDFIAIAKPDGEILYINRGGRELTGLPLSKHPLNCPIIAGLEGGRFGHPRWAADKVAKEGFDTAIREGFWEAETALVDKEGNEIPVSQIIFSHYDEDGKVSHLSTIMRDISTQKKLEEALRVQAERDGLTGLYNRHWCEGAIDGEIYRANRYGRGFSLLMFDVDHFKYVNDTYGHTVGDKVLRQLSELATQSVRQSDIVSRWGGEEFMVLMPEVEGGSAIKAAEKLRNAIAQAEFSGPGHITISVGASSYIAGEMRDEIVTRVDDAMYRAKSEGRDRVVAL
ncbi:MAG: diguanylate cyclase [Halomonas sp.]|uniref:sensor domain-containing diguanylate cyclase n=1 Tax=Halomonas sp. TaxID=1486246 RepID=UPI0028706E4D|nr:diguanylate cyclase [Halomonas sp.]MDR9439396.1 diguanylate cyclase [Halomonas sp.]